MKKVIFIFILILFYSGKTYAQYDLSIEQKESYLPIRIGADTTINWIFKISFPLVFEITNNTPDTLRFSGFSYFCNPLGLRKSSLDWDSGGLTCNYADNKIERFKERDPARLFKGKSSQTYVYFTSHIPSNDSLQQVVFAPYLDRMRDEKVTILEIESIQELKSKNSKLIDLFMKGDSIDFSFRDRHSFYHEIIATEVK